ncbi:MAG: hypothetical protein ACT4OI_03630, partial [Methanobacteriota archaeon]
RKMGSKPCPVCGTLNSVTATVCHKCGSLMKDARPPMGGGGAPPPAVRRPPPATTQLPPAQPPPKGAQPPPGTPPAATDAGPRRLIRRPAQGPPGVLKKIIRRPADQTGQTSESSEDQSQGKDEDL